jgi:hypothetical protein
VSGRIAELLAIAAAATAMAVVMGAAVLRAPSERMFGMEIVGRHHDPFTVMQQFERPIGLGPYSQPVTDVAGALIARVTGPVAAYNAVILLSFPLAALAAFLLARHLALSRTAAAIAALAYAFSPFHIAHAAYHPHIAQIQWLPLYLLALWRCLDAATPAAVALLALATLAVTLSNFYGGLIAAVITPAAVAAYWLVMRPAHRRAGHALTITMMTLVLIAACGLTYAWYAAPAVVANRDGFAVPRADLFLYSAKWWSYLVPPAAHPVAGPAAQRIWTGVGVRDGLLEQQVYIGWSIIALGAVAVAGWAWHGRHRQSVVGIRVPVLVVVALTALVCSLSPERAIGSQIVAAPSALLYSVLPMFRAYARFGVVVQLMAALLAGIGIDFLRRAGTTPARLACAALVTLAAVEYAVAPSALWRDVLPTTAHRWVARQPSDMRALDCMPLNSETQSIQWLTANRVLLWSRPASDCTEPNFSDKLAAGGYTHLLVRRDTADGRWFAGRPAPDGLRVAANFENGQVFSITARHPTIYTAAMTGFFSREHDAEWSWRWMGADAAWTIINTNSRAIVVGIGLEVAAFHRERRMELMLDGHLAQTLVIEPARRVYQIGPLTVPPGSHELVFHPTESPSVADDLIKNGDPRRLSFAVGTWKWTVREEQE